MPEEAFICQSTTDYKLLVAEKRLRFLRQQLKVGSGTCTKCVDLGSIVWQQEKGEQSPSRCCRRQRLLAFGISELPRVTACYSVRFRGAFVGKEEAVRIVLRENLLINGKILRQVDFIWARYYRVTTVGVFARI